MARTDQPYVLLIDDNEATGALIKAILREYQVEIASDGAEAIERLKTTSYAAVLLDIRMPNVDGFGVLDFLSANHPEVLRCVIVLTAAVTAADLSKVREYPIAAIVTKPFEVETILNTVRACVGNSGGSLGNVLSSGMILLIADLLRQRWL